VRPRASARPGATWHSLRLTAAAAGKPKGMARLEDYSFGRLTVDGHEHTRDLIVLPDRVVSDWWRREGHSLAMEDLDEVLDELPRRLVLGVGAHGRLRPDPAVIAELERRGVQVECLPTDAAVRRYGELDERATAAALHLTC
jgi:hypothetical protein